MQLSGTICVQKLHTEAHEKNHNGLNTQKRRLARPDKTVEDIPDTCRINGAEQNPREEHDIENPELSENTAEAIRGCDPPDERAFDSQVDTVEESPPNERPSRPVPQPPQEESQDQVTGATSLAYRR